MVQYILHSTLCIFILCLLLFAVFVSIFKLLGYLSFLHLYLAHKLRLYIFSAVYISRYKKKNKKSFLWGRKQVTDLIIAGDSAAKWILSH